MIHLGRKRSSMEVCAKPTKEDKNKEDFPYLSISDIDLGLDENDVGKIIDAVVKLKVNGVSKNISDNNGKPKKAHSANFDVCDIEIKRIKGSQPDENWSVDEILEHEGKMKK